LHRTGPGPFALRGNFGKPCEPHKLAAFYAERSLTRSPIEPEDQAEAILLLVAARLSKTTGHVIPVDGGLQDGFLR
jgi:NAD(P)-dependent dehydrogenase (short-subunit alcohol dehydrogenase family)